MGICWSSLLNLKQGLKWGLVIGHDQTNFRNDLPNYCYSYSLSGHLFFSFFIILHYYFCHNRWFFSGFIYFLTIEKYFFALRDDTHDIHENRPIFKNPHPLVQLLPKYFHPLDLGQVISSEPPLFSVSTH